MIALTSVIAAVILARSALRAEGRTRAVLVACAIGCVVVLAFAAPRGMILRKTLGALVMPMGLAWAAAIGAALVLWWRGRRALCGTLVAVAVILTILGNEPLAAIGVGYIEGAHGVDDPFEAEPFDAIVVLGGGTASTPSGGVQLGQSGDRVALAARLYHRGQTRYLVTSGAPIRGFIDHDSARASLAIWTDLQIPADAVVIAEGARTTGEEASRIAPLVQERGWSRVGLLSSARHLARARPLFEAQGLDLVPIAADVRRRDVRWQGLVSLIPNGPAAADIHGVCWELVGRLAS